LARRDTTALVASAISIIDDGKGVASDDSELVVDVREPIGRINTVEQPLNTLLHETGRGVVTGCYDVTEHSDCAMNQGNIEQLDVTDEWLRDAILYLVTADVEAW